MLCWLSKIETDSKAPYYAEDSVDRFFDSFSMKFSGALPLGSNGEKYLFIAVEHLTFWPIVRVVIRYTPDLVLPFLKNDILFTFGLLQDIISDNGRCFTASRVQVFMDGNDIKWKLVLQYAPMSNKKAERMVGTIKQATKQTALGTRDD